MDTLVPSRATSCSLYLNKATLGGVPSVATRHNTPSRSHALYSLVLSSKKKGPVVAIIVSVVSDGRVFCGRYVHFIKYVYIIAWSAVVLGINSTSNAGSNFHEAKPSEISCITSAINP